MPELVSPDNKLTVDLDAIAHNLASMRALMPAGCRVAGVVKADAYGHGAVQVAGRLKTEGAEFLAVATIAEALELRQADIEGPIMLLLGLWPSEAALAVEHDLLPVTDRLEVLEALAAAGQAAGREAQAQIKVDTGMARLGVRLEDALELLQAAAKLEGVRVTGLVSHLATQGLPGSDHARKQSSDFIRLLSTARNMGHELADSSLAASGAVMVPPLDAQGDTGLPAVVRLGISLYGGLPNEGSAGIVDLRSAMKFSSRLIAVKQVPADTPVSYGCTWIAPNDTWLGVVPVGYADGYSRSFSNQGVMLVQGRRVPVRGRVCMNLTMLELADLGPQAQVGDEVVILGRQGDEEITLDELAGLAGTIPYEIACSFGAANPLSHTPAAPRHPLDPALGAR
jgi:alanine racemase